MNAPGIDPQFAAEITRQKQAVAEREARWAWGFKAVSIASPLVGIGAWFLQRPMDRDWELACAVGASVWLVGVCLISLFHSKGCDTPKCPQCGFAWEDEGGSWPAWKHCPGCGLAMGDEAGPR